MAWEGTANTRPVVAVTAFLVIPLATGTKAHQLLPTYTLEESFHLQLSSWSIPIGQDSVLKSSCRYHTSQLIQGTNFKSVKMFSPRILVAIVAFASATLAADNSTCWYFLPNPSFLVT